MGIKFILPLIASIVMTVILGTQVAPSLAENMKIAKVENSTISNQNLIKDAIVKYIKLEGKAPTIMKDLEPFILMSEQNDNNLFNGNYGFKIDKKKGILKIFTTISDENADKYFSNSLKFPNKPICIEFDEDSACTGKFETFYLLDEDTFKSIPIPPIGSIEDILDRFTNVDEVGKKYDETTLEGGEKDYIVDIPNNQVTEYVYVDNEWKPSPNPTKNVGGFGKDTGVFISDLEWSFIDGLGNEIKQKHEKVHCENTTLLGQEVFVINENTKLGELVWVAPFMNSVSAIQTKIFTNNYIPNNICTSNVSSMQSLFNSKTSFNSPLNRWNTSNVKTMGSMFSEASIFNNGDNAGESNRPLNWNVSNVTDMSHMFSNAKNFNQDISKWDVGKVTNMSVMFQNAEKFNQALDNWDVSKVINMGWMFLGVSTFNQNISNWDVSNVKTMDFMFRVAEEFNQDLSGWCVSKRTSKPLDFDGYANSWNKTNRQPIWGKAKVIETINENGSIRNSKCQIEQDNGTCNIYDLINQNSLINSNFTCQ